MTEEKPVKYAQITDRMFAANIDLLLMLLFLMPANKIGLFYSFVSVYLLLALYFIVTTRLYGATLGKKVVGIKVVDSITGKNISTNQSIIRFITYGVSVAPLFLGFVMAAFNNRKRTLHDRLADTVVILDENRWYKKYFDRLKRYFNIKS